MPDDTPPGTRGRGDPTQTAMSLSSSPVIPGRSLRPLAGLVPYYINCREADVIETLYRPCLAGAHRYVRGAGYFRSSVFRLMTEDLLNFCIAGGRMSLITSTQMTLSDFDEAVRAYASTGFEDDLKTLLSDVNTIEPTRMLCALICNGSLDIWMALLRDDIYHEKKGYFTDDSKNTVAFDGSGNETLTALKPFDAGNAESFNVSCSWNPETWVPYGSSWKSELDRVLDQDPTLTFPVVPISDVDREFIHDHGVDLVLESHRQAARTRQRQLSEKWDRAFGGHRRGKGSALSEQEPSLPPLRAHQSAGLAAWAKAGHRGILEHATGSGKTITALSAIADHRERGGKTVILVPSEALFHQWKEEVAHGLPGVVPVGLGWISYMLRSCWM